MNRLMVIMVGAVFILAPLVGQSQEQTEVLRNEIVAYVVNPCYLASALRNPVEGFSAEQTVELVKLMTPQATDDLVAALLPIVQRIDTLEQRVVFYEIGKKMCIDSALAASMQP